MIYRPSQMKSAGRYEIRDILGEGGMGVVYRGFDPVMNREVTIKTIRDPQDRVVLELFKRECAVLASMSHPNIVEIFDVGEVEEAGAKRPYFVMPLLKGATLQELVRTSSHRLTAERSIQMISQACRGLQAAHEHNLVHRDLKPSNLFVLEDDSIKIIDFGVAHLMDHRSVTGLKGTLLYMAPEQIQRKQPTALTDQFSLAVVAYEMLSRRHPFGVSGEEDLIQAILRFSPPPVSEFNPAVSPAISQVIHKALAKEPFYRFSDVREFSECLQKALRGEPIPVFDPARIIPRLERARKAFDSGDVDDAAEILSELESESYLTPEIGVLRKEIEEVRRARTVKQLLETARKRFDEEEYVRALQKVQEVLDLDPANTEAYTLKGAIETKRRGTQIEEWFRLANQHMENHAYSHARQALQKVLDIRPKEARALTLLTEVERQEQEYLRLRIEKQQAFKSAVDAFKRGDVGSALNKMERVLDLDRRAAYSTSPDQGAEYQRFYEEVCSKRDQLSSQESEARRHLSENNFAAASSICDAVLAEYPNNVVFGILRDDIEQAQRQEVSAYVARIDKEVVAESDLDRKVAILEEARKKHPLEERFEHSLQQVRARRDKVNSVVGRARMLEESRQFSDALGQWEVLRNVYPRYPGLDIEIDRLKKRREQQARADAKAHWVTQVEQALAVHNYAKATALTADAMAEFPNDPELLALGKQVQQSQQRTAEAETKASQGKELYEEGRTLDGLGLLREAFQLDPHNSVVRNQLVEFLLKEAGTRLDENWRAAEPLIREALDLDPGQPLAKSLNTLLRDKRQDEEVSAALSRARDIQSQGDVGDAIKELDKVLTVYTRDTRLIKLRTSLSQSLSADDRETLRTRDLADLNQLAQESKETSDLGKLESILDRSQIFSKYENDAAFRESLSAIEERVRKKQTETATDNAPAAPIPADSGHSSTSPAPARKVSAGPPQSGPPFLDKWKTVFAKVPGLAWGGAGLVIIGLLIWGIFAYSSAKSAADARRLASRTVPVRINIPSAQQLRVTDRNGNDVTENLEAGLSAGEYKLTASRAGFAPIAFGFTINPAAEPEKLIEVPWQALPAELRIRVKPRLASVPAGSLKIDSAEVAFDDNDEAGAQLRNGSHSIAWTTPGGDAVEFEVVVNDDQVDARNLTVQGRSVGLLATVQRGVVNYQTMNSAGGVIHASDGQPVPDKASGTFPIESSKPVSFAVKPGGYPLGEVLANPDGHPLVFVYLAPQSPEPKPAGSRRAEPTVSGPTATSTTSRPTKSQEEIDRDRKQQEDEKKKQEDEKRRREFEKKLHPTVGGKQ
jgi:eukaryotic-like serine/threonine-protein kinase